MTAPPADLHVAVTRDKYTPGAWRVRVTRSNGSTYTGFGLYNRYAAKVFAMREARNLGQPVIFLEKPREGERQ